MAQENIEKLSKQNSAIIDNKTSMKSIIDDNADRKANKELNKTKGGSFIGTTISYMRKDKKLTAIILISVIFSAIATALTPKLTEQLMYAIYKELDPTYSNGSYWGLTWTTVVAIMIALIVVVGFFTWLMQFSTGMLGKRMEVDLRRRAMEKLVEEDMSYYSDKKIGEMLTKIISDSQILGDQAAVVPSTFLNAVFTLIATIIVAFTINWQLTLVAIGMYLATLIAMAICFLPLKNRMYKVRTVISEVNGNVMDRINTVKLIKSSGTEKYEENYFVEQHKEYYKQQHKMTVSQSALITVLLIGMTSVQTVIIVAAALIYGTSNPNFASMVVVFVSAVAAMTQPIMQMIRVIVGMVQAATASKRMYELLISPVRIDNHFKDKSGIVIDEIKGDILFKGVEFRYPEKPNIVILPKFDFTFKEGKSYAFVGTTGAGKSTISKLLLRFYDPSEGQVLINGNIDLKDVYLSSYLSHVGYVEQEPSILLGNVFDNVRYAKMDASDEEIIEACKKAELHDLVMTWPDGYRTILGERGFMLSGGQKQRLVIARMFLKDPQLLILDEATSALDNVVEKEIQEQLDKLMKGRTTVTIAHRLSTIKNVDEILVLAPNKGIVQRGTFDELKKIPGHFKNLYDAGNKQKD